MKEVKFEDKRVHRAVRPPLGAPGPPDRVDGIGVRPRRGRLHPQGRSATVGGRLRFSSDEADNKRVHMKAAASYSMFKYLFATVDGTTS